MTENYCPCGSGMTFSKCCEPYLSREQNCDTAEKLMRSRYCAFAINNPDYLLFTSSTELKSQLTRQELELTIAQFQFVKLQVLSASDNQVKFCAHMLSGSEYHQLNELSTFVKEDNLWKYDSGQLKDIPVVKLSRNDPCPCGSGKKFKKCHQV